MKRQMASPTYNVTIRALLINLFVLLSLNSQSERLFGRVHRVLNLHSVEIREDRTRRLLHIELTVPAKLTHKANARVALYRLRRYRNSPAEVMRIKTKGQAKKYILLIPYFEQRFFGFYYVDIMSAIQTRWWHNTPVVMTFRSPISVTP
jgi:hypothetical protein